MIRILEKTLQYDPKNRPTAQGLKDLIEKDLPVFLRRESTAERFAPIDELHQLKTFLPSEEILALMPADERARFINRLEGLKQIPGFDTQQLEEIKNLEDLLNA